MSASLNKIFLLGNLTRDVELKHINSGTSVVSFCLAVNRTYINSDGERMDDVFYLDIIAWNRLAEACDSFLAKGSHVLIEGRLQMRNWKQKDGKKRSKVEVVAQNIKLLSGGVAQDIQFISA
jgi:single-strand DNA-binding protein